MSHSGWPRRRWPRMHAVGGAFAAGVALGRVSGPLSTTPWVWGAALALLIALARGKVTVAIVLFGTVIAGGLRQAMGAQDAVAVAQSAMGMVDDRRVDVIAGTVTRKQSAPEPGARFIIRAEAPLHSDVDVRVYPGKRARGPTVWPGDRVILRGRLRFRRGQRVTGAQAPRGPPLRISVAGDQMVVLDTATAAPLARWAAQSRHELSARIAAVGGDGPGNAVVRAMVAGDRSALNVHIREAVRAAGVAHVLSVSGLHLACVALLVFAIARRATAASPLGKRFDPGAIGAVLAAPVAVAYTLVTGAEPPTVRALVVVLVLLSGAALGRRGRALDALGLAAIGILAANPDSLWDPSFQLSFAAAAILALIARRTPSRARGFWSRAWGWISGLVRTSLWAQAATAPITAATFGQVTTGAVLGNLVAIPACELGVLPLGLAGSALSVVWPAGGDALLSLAVIMAAAMVRAAAWIGTITPLLTIPPPRAPELVAAFVILGCAVAGTRAVVSRRRAIALATAAAACLAGSYGWSMAVAPAQSTALRVSFIDVGQGDAAVIELPGGAVWLVDAGGRPFVAAPGLSRSDRRRRRAGPARAIVTYLRAHRITHIDRVILSHPHPDHYAGLWAVAKAVEIEELWVPRAHAAAPEPLEYRALLVMLAAGGTRIVSPPLGLAATDHGVSAWVLAPRYGGKVAADPVLSANDNSLVVRIDFAGRRVLFAGDIEAESELRLANGPGAAALAADVVKVAHHGSATSSTLAFARATSPRWAVISCGIANRFEFPAEAVLATWRRVDARIARTDLAGTVTVTVGQRGTLSITAFDPRGLGADDLRPWSAHGM